MKALKSKAWRLLLLSCALLFGLSANAAAKELNGYYQGDDGGAYFVRQIGDKIYWVGEDPDGAWTNVFVGTVTGNKITGKFWDVPKGKTQGAGEITWEIQRDGTTMTKVSSSTPFGTRMLKQAGFEIVNGVPKGLPPELRSRPQGFSGGAQSLTGGQRVKACIPTCSYINR